MPAAGQVDPVAGIWICTFAVWLYTVSGGLISVAFTDCGQALVGWLGPGSQKLHWHWLTLLAAAGAGPLFLRWPRPSPPGRLLPHSHSNGLRSSPIACCFYPPPGST